MKIVVINGQNHKGSTWNIGKMLLESLEGEKEVREYFLPRDLDHFCSGCFACLEDRARCPYWKEKEPILRDMLEAELLVFTSPNYCMMPSAPMKAFLDLFFTNWLTHKPPREMFSKKAVVISTAAGAGAKKAAKLIAGNLINWGIPEVHTYAAVVNAMRWDMIPPKKKAGIEKDIKRLAHKLSRRKKTHVGVRTRFLFWFYGGMQKAGWGASPAEKQYWVENGWLSGTKPWKEQ
mgnify:FL=1